MVTSCLAMLNRVTTQGAPGFADGFASEALLREPNGLALDQSRQELYVADQGNHAIRVIDLSAGRITTVAGGPEDGNSSLRYPAGVNKIVGQN